MSKHRQKSRPVPPQKANPNVIRITLGLVKPRGIIAKRGGRHHTRTLDIAKGRSRKFKHSNNGNLP